MALTIFRRGMAGARNINKRLLEITAAFNRGARDPITATPAVLANAGAATYTAAHFATGLITRDPNGANRTDTTDTAANLIGASGLNLTVDYAEKEVMIVNTADAAETITLAGGTGVTLKGTITIEQNCAIRVAAVRTSPTTISLRLA